MLCRLFRTAPRALRSRQGGGLRPRVLVAALSLSAVGFVGLVAHEGYSDRAIIPTKGDVPTVGFGSTVHEDGRRVKLGDTTTPVNALAKSMAHINKDQAQMRQCLAGSYLTQGMFDAFSTVTYNIGAPSFCGSTMAKRIRAGDYAGACDAILMWRYMGKFDCSTPGNKRCMGLWTRRQQEHAQCVAALPDEATP